MANRIVTAADLKNAVRVGELLPVYYLDDTTVVKAGDVVRMAEAEAMRFVREKTSVTVPEVFNAYVDNNNGQGYIIMERVKGDCLRDV